jgi:hypothetical protein
MVDPTWASSPFSYAGWVPNVGSHLSFSLIGSRTGTDVRRFSCRKTLPTRIARTVCALQRRVVDDYLFPPWIMKWVRPDIAQDWLLVGGTDEIDVAMGIKTPDVPPPSLSDRLHRRPLKTPEKVVLTARDEQGVLVGRIYVIPHELNAAARKIQTAMLADVRGKLTKASRSQGEESIIWEIERQVIAASPGRVVVNFALMRTGEVRIWFEEKRAGLNEHEHDYIARQAYFFIKDMTHRHFHHHPVEDQITPLTSFDTSDAASCRNAEIGWRRETLWSLARYAEKRMGSERLNELREAVGMLAYADAFQKTLLDHLRDAVNPLKYIPNSAVYGYDFAHIRESTRVRIDQTSARRTVTGQLLAAMFAGGLASLSLLSSLVSTHNARLRDPAVHSGESLPIAIWEGLLKWTANHPFSTVGISATILFAIFALSLSDVLFTQPRRRAQGLRGLTLTLAHSLTWSSKTAYRTLVLFYVLILVSLVGFSTWFGAFIASGGLTNLLETAWTAIAGIGAKIVAAL